MLAAIWAQDRKGLIGKENKLPWHLPNDLLFFKTMTEDSTIVMGRKTFEGMGKQPLPNRETIVLTSQVEYEVPSGVKVMHQTNEVIAYAEQSANLVFITGGADIYQQFLPQTDILYRTMVEETFEGDSYFSEVDWSQWELVAQAAGKTDEKNLYPHQHEMYSRCKKTSE